MLQVKIRKKLRMDFVQGPVEPTDPARLVLLPAVEAKAREQLGGGAVRPVDRVRQGDEALRLRGAQVPVPAQAGRGLEGVLRARLLLRQGREHSVLLPPGRQALHQDWDGEVSPYDRIRFHEIN